MDDVTRVSVVVKLTSAGGERRERQLKVADRFSYWGAAPLPSSSGVVNLRAGLGGAWPKWAFDGTPYTLGRGWQGAAHFVLRSQSEDGRVQSGVWRLGDEVGAYWRAERVKLMLGDKLLPDVWRLYIAPTSATPDLAGDVVGLRRLALVLDSWLDTAPAVGDEVSFNCGNVAFLRPPAPNYYPHLDGWGTDSIYTKMALTRRSSFLRLV